MKIEIEEQTLIDFVYDMIMDDHIANVDVSKPEEGEIISGRVYRDIVKDRIKRRLNNVIK